jgi:hypothetical protein
MIPNIQTSNHGNVIVYITIMATSFSGGGSRSTRREPPTLGKQLVNFMWLNELGRWI